MIAYAVESWEQAMPEMSSHWDAHWKEVALDHEVIALDPDLEEYGRLDKAGGLHIVTVRQDGLLVGYHISFLRPHIHYKQSLSAFTDIYYVAPAFRRGLVGTRLFQYVEETLKAKGVQKMFTGTKLHLDVGKIFERLGWRETERLYTKVIGA